MWQDEQQQLDRELEDLRRARPQAIITRGQRRLATPQEPRQHQEEALNLANMAAAAPSPENNEQQLQPERDTPEPVDLTGQFQEGGGAVANPENAERQGVDQHGQVAGVRGLETPLGMNPPLDPTSAAAARVREIVNRANERQNASWAGRDLEENWGPQMAFGGARPRPRNRAELAGRGGFLNRIENRQLTSPRRAYQMPEDPGRFLARRLERMERIERLEDERGNRDRQEVQELRRRHEEERANWQRQQDEIAQRMAQMQQQLDALRLAPPQQQQPNIPVQPVQPPQVPQAPQLMNPFNVPPPPLPNPVAVRPYPPPPQFPQPEIQQQIPPQPQLLHQNQLVQSPRNWQLQPPHGGPRVATPVGPRTPMRHDVSDDEDQWGRNRANNRGRIDRRNLKLRTFKGKDVDAWKSLFDDFAEEFQWSEVEKRLQIKAHVDDWIRTMFTNMPPDTTAAEMMARLVNRFGVTLTSTEVENNLMTIERKSGDGLYCKETNLFLPKRG